MVMFPARVEVYHEGLSFVKGHVPEAEQWGLDNQGAAFARRRHAAIDCRGSIEPDSSEEISDSDAGRTLFPAPRRLLTPPRQQVR